MEGVIYLPGHVEYQASKQAENESRINISIDRFIAIYCPYGYVHYLLIFAQPK